MRSLLITEWQWPFLIVLRNISPLTKTFLRTQQTLSWPLPSKGICKDSCSRLQVGGCKYYLHRRNPTLNFPRSQYVVYPAWAAGWYWARPGDHWSDWNIKKRKLDHSFILQSRFQRNITDGDFEFLKFLSHDDLTARSTGLPKTCCETSRA